MKEVPDMIERHDDHDGAPHQVNGCNAALEAGRVHAQARGSATNQPTKACHAGPLYNPNSRTACARTNTPSIVGNTARPFLPCRSRQTSTTKTRSVKP